MKEVLFEILEDEIDGDS